MASMQNARNFVKGSMSPKGQPTNMGRPGESQQDPVPARPGESYPDEMEDIVADTGGWSYRQAGDGRIEIVSVPPTSKLKPGTVLDPRKIAAISDTGQRARAQRAFDSIQSVMAGGEPIPRGGGGKKAPPTPTDSSRAAGGAVDRPAAGSLSEPTRDTLSGVTGPRRPAEGQ